MTTGYCPYGAGLCEHGGPACGKGFENLIECRIHYEAKRLISNKSTDTPED